MARPLPARVCAVTDGDSSARELVRRVEALLEAGIRWVQLRRKDLTTRELFDLAGTLRAATREHGAVLTVNDRLDVALAVDADGVHLGWQSLPVAVARGLVGERRLVGVSTHDEGEARAAAAAGADHVFYGPVFETPSKRGLLEPRGVDALAAVVDAVDLPVAAIGGIDAGRVGAVAAAGAAACAVLSCLMASDDPGSAARALLAAVDESGARRGPG